MFSNVAMVSYNNTSWSYERLETQSPTSREYLLGGSEVKLREYEVYQVDFGLKS